jgi:hypothetical protein
MAVVAAIAEAATVTTVGPLVVVKVMSDPFAVVEPEAAFAR